MIRPRQATLGVLLLFGGCVQHPVPPATVPAARAPALVSASHDATWNAVLDALAARQISITSADKAAGLIVAGQSFAGRHTTVATDSLLALTDCGRRKDGLFAYSGPLAPARVNYNVLVRDRGQATSLQLVAKYSIGSASRQIECASLGVFESAFEAEVKARAEATR